MKEKEKYGLRQVGIRLAELEPFPSSKPVSRPKDAVEIIREYLEDMDREYACAIYLRSNGTVIAASIISMGTINLSLMSTREVFKPALLLNAASVIILHNHVSGSLTPSESDIKVTDTLMLAGQIMGINVLDHIICGRGEILSIMGDTAYKKPEYRQFSLAAEK